MNGDVMNASVRRLYAAVYDEDDPRAANSARVVPSHADKELVGTAILGYWKKSTNLRKALTWPQVIAWQRYNELGRLTAYRHKHGLDMGPPIGWASVLANLSAALGDEVTITSLSDLCRRLNLPEIDPDIVAGIARDVEKARRVWNTYELLPAAAVGALIQLTAPEREECSIKRIDAWEESSADRKRRLTRERVARHRERKRESGKH
jgi:hypothetical protein